MRLTAAAIPSRVTAGPVSRLWGLRGEQEGFAGSWRLPSVWGRGGIASFDLLLVLKVELLHKCLVPALELDKSPAMNLELWRQPI